MLVNVASPKGSTPWNANIQYGDDLHLLRAKELDKLGETRRAERIRSCSTEDAPFGKRTCKQRACPTCAARLADRNAQVIAAAIREMDHPFIAVLSLRSKTKQDLRPAITRYREAHVKLRRRACYRKIVAGIGALELKATDDGFAWNVHAHFVLDAKVVDVAACQEAWSELTSGAGSFLPHPTDPRPRSIERVAQYAAKADTWCPEPGSKSLAELALLMEAVRGRQLLIRWPRPGGEP